MTVFFNLRISIWYVFMVSDFCWDFSFFYLLRQSKHTYFKACASELQSFEAVDTLLFLLAIFHLILSPVFPLDERVELCIWKVVCKDILKLRMMCYLQVIRALFSSGCLWPLSRRTSVQPQELRRFTDRAGGQQVLRLTLTVDPSSSPRAVGRSGHSLSPQSWETQPSVPAAPLGLVSTPDVLQKSLEFRPPCSFHCSPHPCPPGSSREGWSEFSLQAYLEALGCF